MITWMDLFEKGDHASRYTVFHPECTYKTMCIYHNQAYLKNPDLCKGWRRVEMMTPEWGFKCTSISVKKVEQSAFITCSDFCQEELLSIHSVPVNFESNEEHQRIAQSKVFERMLINLWVHVMNVWTYSVPPKSSVFCLKSWMWLKLMQNL